MAFASASAVRRGFFDLTGSVFVSVAAPSALRSTTAPLGRNFVTVGGARNDVPAVDRSRRLRARYVLCQGLRREPTRTRTARQTSW